MPAVTVRLPAALTSPEPATELRCEARTVGEALLAVAAERPRFGQRLFYGDRLLVTVAVNGRHLDPSEAKAAELAAGDRIDVLAPVAGG
jgi:molybdopterin converting factor small subunit